MRRCTLTEARLEAAGVGTFFRPRDIEQLGVSIRDLQKLVQTGEVDKLEKGLYRLAAVEPVELETLAMVASAIPSGIVCLLSALRLYEIGTQSPHQVWTGLDRKARRPKRLGSLMRVVRFSGAMLTYGVVTRSVLGVPVKVTAPARTVVDCFRYRRKIGLDIAAEALRDAVRTRVATVDEIVRAAEVCRARTVIRPYLEVLAT